MRRFPLVLAIFGLSASIALGQCSDGECKIYIDGQLATFKYSIFGKKVGNSGNAIFFKNNSEFDFSRQGVDAELTVRLEQLDKKKTDIHSVKIKPSEIRISGKEDFQLVDASGVLNAGSYDRIDIKFKLLRSANENSRGEIVIPVAFRRSRNNAAYLDVSFKLKIRYTGLKLDTPPSAPSENSSATAEEAHFWKYNKLKSEAGEQGGKNLNSWDTPMVDYLNQYPNGRYKAEAWRVLRRFCAARLNTDRVTDKLERAIATFNGSSRDRCDCSNAKELGQDYIARARKELAYRSGAKSEKSELFVKAERGSISPDCNRALRIASASGSSCKDLLKIVQSDAYKTCAAAVKTARARYSSIRENDQSLLKQLTEDLDRAKTEAEKLHAYQDYLNGVGRKGTCNREKQQETEAKVRAISAAIGAFAVHAKDEGSGELSVEIVNAGVDKIDDLEITIQKDGKKLEEGRDIYEKADVEKAGDKITFRLKDLDQGKYTLTVYNNSKGLSSEATVVIYGGPGPAGVKVLETDNTSIRFIVKGGVPPYYLYFRKKGETVWLEDNSFDLTQAKNPHQRIFEVDYSRFASLDADRGDDIELYIQDKGSLLGPDKAISFVLGERSTTSHLPKAYILIGSIGGLVLVGLFFFPKLLVRLLPRNSAWRMFFQSRK